jgi:hypothetical protein
VAVAHLGVLREGGATVAKNGDNAATEGQEASEGLMTPRKKRSRVLQGGESADIVPCRA